MRTLSLAVLALAVSASTASADLAKGSWAIGFTDLDAPFGGRYMFSPKVGLDVGLGFLNVGEEDEDNENRAGDKHGIVGMGYPGSTFTLRAGVPIMAHKGDMVDLSVIPGFGFTSISPDEGDSETVTEIRGVIAVDFWLTKTITVGASHGLAIQSNGGTNFGTLGDNVTDFGIHWWMK